MSLHLPSQPICNQVCFMSLFSKVGPADQLDSLVQVLWLAPKWNQVSPGRSEAVFLGGRPGLQRARVPLWMAGVRHSLGVSLWVDTAAQWWVLGPLPLRTHSWAAFLRMGLNLLLKPSRRSISSFVQCCLQLGTAASYWHRVPRSLRLQSGQRFWDPLCSGIDGLRAGSSVARRVSHVPF